MGRLPPADSPSPTSLTIPLLIKLLVMTVTVEGVKPVISATSRRQIGPYLRIISRTTNRFLTLRSRPVLGALAISMSVTPLATEKAMAQKER